MFPIHLHCILGLCIRLLLIAFGEVQDKLFHVQYTDIDYHVFTDASRLVLLGRSPFERRTYRYSPLIAFLLTPNITLHPAFGKILFSVIDVCVGYIIYRLVHAKVHSESTATNCSFAWLYNPFPIVIATRGNADAISAALVLATLLSVQKGWNPLVTGFFHAIAFHVRLYPLVFTLPLYLTVKDGPPLHYEKNLGLLKKLYFMLFPDKNQMYFVVSFCGVLISCTALCYWMYGYQFLFESILYHIIRRDTRHNFSVYFYMLYLTSDMPHTLWHKLALVFPQALLLLVISFVYSTKKTLDFCFLIQAIVMVTYNSVITSQYFIWVLSILPVSVTNLALSSLQATAFFILWVAAQVAWLLPAYLLEFRGSDTFIYIWLQGLVFFTINITILAKLIQAYHFNFNRKIKLKFN